MGEVMPKKSLKNGGKTKTTEHSLSMATDEEHTSKNHRNV